MPSIQDNAFIMLRAICDEAQRDTDSVIDTSELLPIVGLSPSLGRAAVNYLIGKRLVRDERMVGELPTVSITVHGIDQIEAAINNPNRPTNYFQPITNILNIRNYSGGAIQQGNTSSTQMYQQASIGSIDFGALASQLETLRSALASEATSAEHHVAIGQIASAEVGAKEQDPNKVLVSLKGLGTAGKWVADTAAKIVAPLAVEVIKKAIES